MKIRYAFFLAAMLIPLMPARGQTLSPDQLTKVDFEQRLGATLPLNAVFRDESGTLLPLGHFCGERPVVLALVYYDCPNLCTVVLGGLLDSLRNVRMDVGRDFDVVIVSIKPGDSPTLAAEKKHTFATRYGRPGSAKGWHFLTGDALSIQQLSDAVGFHYFYEPQSKQYAHPSGIVVITPKGTVSRYFMGIEYPPKDVRFALAEASQSKIGTLANRLLLLCFHYDPHSGRYTLIISRVMQFAGMGTVLCLGLMIVRMARHERRREDLS